MLLRTESVASSKIEHVEADVADYVRALHGSRANASATAMAAATVALEALVGSVADGSALTKKAVLAAHRALMRDDPAEARYAGRVREVQNWIGGSDHSPRGALYVPPPPDLVDDYLADLIRFANRDDLSALVQAAVVHAQFESVHPFTDGNGRIGRALINTVLRRRGFTRSIVVPLASALVARRELYFDVLTEYRHGDPEPIVRAFAVSCAIAAQESTVSAERLALLPDQWRDAVGGARRGSATDSLLGVLALNPVLTAEQAEVLVGSGTSATYRAVVRLVEAGVLRPLTDRKRDQVWGAGDLLDEIDDLGLRIAVRARDAF
jgi:Fic family protein